MSKYIGAGKGIFGSPKEVDKFIHKPTLGIRWFWDGCGYPNTHGYPTWLVAPDFIQQYILPNFNVPPNLENRIKKFLEGEIKGENLQKSK